jgi:iron complex outermembrane recepter protein
MHCLYERSELHCSGLALVLNQGGIMKKIVSIIVVSLICVEGPLWAAEEDMNFYKQEAEVVSASLRPQSAQQTPATVYVITQQDIKDSGEIYWWDLFRGVPGVDVRQFRTGQGEIGIRGLVSAWTNLVLVQVDSRSVLDGYFDHIAWESIPVTMDEIDRIEVVEGPASAVYGANAVSGVINIITKTPEQLQGGKASFVGGERDTYHGSALYGKKDGQVGYRFNGGWRSTNRFEDADAHATKAGLFNGLVNYALSEHAGVSLSGGLNKYETLNTVGALGLLNDKGTVSFTRADAHYKDTRLRAYWNAGRTEPESGLVHGPVDYDQYDIQADQALSLPFKNSLVFGASYRRNTAKSQIMNGGDRVHQDLWSVFFEDKWEMAERWMLMASGRVDRHPLTPVRFSPRGSLLYTPVPEHVFRASAGTAFRNPTLLENYINASETLPTGIPAFPVSVHNLVGSQTLSPETMQSVEVAHTGRFKRFKTNVTGFYYRYKKFIQSVPTLLPPPDFPNVLIQFSNSDDPLTNVGGEVGGEFLMTSSLRLFGNYSYQYLHSSSGAAFPAKVSPRHKANTGIRTHNGGWTTSWELHWVDKTQQVSQLTPVPSDPLFLQPVSAYFLVNAHVGYAFSGRLNGLEIGVNAFNLLNHEHYEALPPVGFANGQQGEIIRGRFTGTVSYKF